MNPSDNQKQTVGSRIKEARSVLGLTQKELCKKTGMPLQSLRGYELSHRTPGGDAIEYLVRFGINANWLLTGEGAMLLSDVPLRPALPKILDVYKAEAPTRHLRVAEMEAHYHSRDPATLRMAITLAEEASAVQAFSLDQRVEMILSFYNRLSKKPDQ